MPTKPTAPISSLTSQRDQRTPETVYDQHKSQRFPNGRPWWGYAEIQTDRRALPAFVCELMPGDHNDPWNSSWSAPWVPTQMREQSGRRYLELNMKRLTLTWNYTLMIADDKQAVLNYYRAAAKIANANGWRAPALGEPVSFQIESILLDAPRSPRIAEAAMAGDPWILGFTEQVNQPLADLLKTSQDRMAEPPVSIDQALRLGEGDRDLDALVAKKVAEALEKIDAAKKQASAERMEKVRSARGKGKRGTVAVG